MRFSVPSSHFFFHVRGCGFEQWDTHRGEREQEKVDLIFIHNSKEYYLITIISND